MIVGIGCDIVEHRITEQLEWHSDTKVLKRIFSTQELDLYDKEKSSRFLAGRFAAKEAVLKCIGTGMQDGISLLDIQILPNSLGKPYINLTGQIKIISDEMGINLWHISITHSSNNSVAFVIAES
ncbi:holo-ACP synthase [Chitinophagaceae bacterium LB-8]|uniref:Holo-[acyl-carrier-protein] synthase n=1 Tax=Paraflavisolibacter caeni TaxID=2982496 RepID=A0A9X3BFX5_9BACT|nr:holo-ACP synthase [Paraflavisolibacter caeni]MCU7549819.1 holo-ACP synthase [Paraflavisolibacter caeni]